MHIERGSPDDQFINLDDRDEVRHWAHLLRTTPEQLTVAVTKVGTSGKAVKNYLEAIPR